MTKLRVRYQTVEFDAFDIHLRTLRDRQQFDTQAESSSVSSASWPLFGVVWEGGRALAQHMSTHDIKDLRILEVGCGIALPSLVLNERGADITASDYNERAGAFLNENTALNKADDIEFVQADWEEHYPDLGVFDLIIGSDVLYERDHAALLGAFIGRHAAPVSTVILVDAGRGYVSKFSSKLTDLGFERTHEVVALGTDGNTGKMLTYTRT
jgi:predicted nicotinamide N-methyase